MKLRAWVKYYYYYYCYCYYYYHHHHHKIQNVLCCHHVAICILKSLVFAQLLKLSDIGSG
jgi:hypothetical protein